MNNHEVISQFLCCPKCHSDIHLKNDFYICNSCNAQYPLIFNIPDFRIDLDTEDKLKEYAEANELIELYNQLSYKELLLHHIKQTTADDLIDVEIDYELGWRERGKKELYKINQLAEKMKAPKDLTANIDGLYIDIGCGKGAMISTMSDYCKYSIGLDYSLIYVVLALKLIEESGFNNVFLMVASNHNLPLRENVAEFVTAIDVIEHVPDQIKGYDENIRVLKDNHFLFLNSPNRYSLFGVEDHVRLWGVGFMPRKFMKTYVKLLSGHPYDDVWLMSYWQLLALAKRHSSEYKIGGIMFDKSKHNLSKKEKFLSDFPFLLFIFNKVFKYFIPSFQMLVKKIPG